MSRSAPTTCTRSSGAPRFEGEVAMRTSIPGVATGLAWTPVGGDILFIEATRIPGKGGLDPDRAARRGHARERPGGAVAGQGQGGRARHRRDAVRGQRHPCPRAGRRDPEGRAVGRGRDVHRARLAADRPHRQERHGDDRRDQPARAGAAGRRHQGEGRRGGARGARHGHPAGTQPQGLRGHPGGGTRASCASSGPSASRTRSTPPSNQLPKPLPLSTARRSSALSRSAGELLSITAPGRSPWRACRRR